MMSDAQPVDWSSLEDTYGSADEVPDMLELLLSASDRGTASNAALDIIDRATYQGTAVSEIAPAVVQLIVSALVDGTAVWLSDALSVLDTIARSVGAWRKTQLRSVNPEAIREVEWEQESLETISAHTDWYKALTHDADPEVRSMAFSTLASSSGDFEGDCHFLRQAFETESNALARACIAQSVIRLATRSSDPGLVNQIVAWGLARLADSEPVVRYRTARSLMATGVEVARAPSLEVMQHDEAAAQHVVWRSEV